MSKQTTPILTAAEGILFALCLYVSGQMLLAFFCVRSMVPESTLAAAQIAICAISVIIGALFTVRRTQWGTLCTSMVVASGFAGILLLGGLLIYDHIAWNSSGGKLLFTIAASGIFSGLIGSKRKKKHKKAAHKADLRNKAGRFGNLNKIVKE